MIVTVPTQPPVFCGLLFQAFTGRGRRIPLVVSFGAQTPVVVATMTHNRRGEFTVHPAAPAGAGGPLPAGRCFTGALRVATAVFAAHRLAVADPVPPPGTYRPFRGRRRTLLARLALTVDLTTRPFPVHLQADDGPFMVAGHLEQVPAAASTPCPSPWRPHAPWALYTPTGIVTGPGMASCLLHLVTHLTTPPPP